MRGRRHEPSIPRPPRYGDLRRSERDALQVASRVGLDATASKMPSGYETRVGERGLTLSGGERQRVAIARALLKDPPVTLHDESASEPPLAIINEALLPLLSGDAVRRAHLGARFDHRGVHH